MIQKQRKRSATLVVVCDDEAIAMELSDIPQEAQSGAAAVKMQLSDLDILERKMEFWMQPTQDA